MKKILVKLASTILNKYGTFKVTSGTKFLCDDGKYYQIVSTMLTNDIYRGSKYEIECNEIVL